MPAWSCWWHSALMTEYSLRSRNQRLLSRHLLSLPGHVYVDCRPLPPDELSAIIHEACGEDNSTAMLTQVIS